MRDFAYRPIPSDPAAHPRHTGAPVRFDTAEVLSQAADTRIVASGQIPPDALAALTAPRAPIAGLDWSRPRLMGVVNVTPDSFSDGGLHLDPAAAIDRALELVAEGADILDIGAESTRPGATPITPQQEQDRALPVIEGILAATTTPISIDTRNAATARAALAAGAVMFNDVSAFTHDPDSARTAAEAGAFVCLMHAQGDPKTMQRDPHYDHVLLDVYDHLAARVSAAVAAGVPRDRIMVDPGIGFGKTLQHNLALLRRISLFHGLGCPILLGVSRKGFIGRLGDEPAADKRAPGSIAIGLNALSQGVQMLRVHDMAETRQAVALWQALQEDEG